MHVDIDAIKIAIEDTYRQLTASYEIAKKTLEDHFPDRDPHELTDASGRPILASMLIARSDLLTAMLKFEEKRD